MDLPKICSKSPLKVDVIKNKRYAWCSCVLSDKQPFCNGAHNKI